MYRALLPEHKPYLPLKWAVVRDTRKNIGLTTARTIREWFPEPYARWRGKPEEPESCTIYVRNDPVVTYDFFGVNSPADHDRFQSYEASGGVWIEEPAPAATNTEYISSGVGPNVLGIAVTSIRGAPFPSVQITMNPPSAEHWTAQLWQIPGYEAAGELESEFPQPQQDARAEIRRQSAVFMFPPGENRALDLKTPGYRDRNRTILMAMGRTDLLARLADGKVGYAQVGEKVTPEFTEYHTALGLQVIPNLPFILSFDFGLNPTCIISQISPNGFLLIHRVFSRENVGMRQLLEQDVHPWLLQQPVTSWWYCGGPEAVEREQSDSEETALRTIVRILGHFPYRRGPVSWSARRDGAREALTKSPGGLPFLRINPTGAALLVRTLSGGWAYKTNSLGQVTRDYPDKKSRFDHIGDAFCHLCCVILGRTDRQSNSPKRDRVSNHPFSQHNQRPLSQAGHVSSRTGA